MNQQLIKKAFVKTLPVMAGYLVLGIGFGILLKKAGYGIFWSLLMSVTIYAGSMQYVTISLLSSGASAISAALTALMVNARHLFYGISMIQKYKEAGAKKGYLIFSLTDETYSLLCSDDETESKDYHSYCLLVSLFNQIYWVSGCVLGSILASVITFNTAGIDFSMTALFVTVAVEQWLTTKNHLPAIAGFGCSILCLFVFGADQFLIPSMLLITLVLSIGRKAMDVSKGGASDE